MLERLDPIRPGMAPLIGPFNRIQLPVPSVPMGPPPAWPPVREGALPPGAEEASHRMVDALLGRPGAPRLADGFNIVFQKLGTPDNANIDLIGELETLRQRIVERLNDQRAAHLAGAKTKHEVMYAECRLALQKRDGLRDQLNVKTSYANAVSFRVGEARAAVSGIEAERPPREAFPSEQEVATWWGRVQQERSKLAGVQKEYDAVIAEAAELTKRLAAAQAELDQLVAEEERLSAAARGEAYTNALGVRCPPVEEL
jgi:hypothetical protein